MILKFFHVFFKLHYYSFVMVLQTLSFLFFLVFDAKQLGLDDPDLSPGSVRLDPVDFGVPDALF